MLCTYRTFVFVVEQQPQYLDLQFLHHYEETDVTTQTVTPDVSTVDG